MSITAKESCTRLIDNIATVISCNNNRLRWLVAALASSGHVLLEDLPGTGKTTLAKALALSLGGDFQRLQCTPDLLPTDILGVSIYNAQDHQFHFQPGPIFTHILLVDEINRAAPRTQSALLEAMAEQQISTEGVTRPLHSPFFVIATQNPIEFHGTYPLPEAQMDRFTMRFALGYVSPEEEVAMMQAQQRSHPLEKIQACTTLEDLLILQQAVRNIAIDDKLARYIVDIVGFTRHADGVKLGAGPRASLALMRVAQALALMDDLNYVLPDHVQEVASSIIAHRLAIEPEAAFSGRTATQVVQEALQQLPVPT